MKIGILSFTDKGRALEDRLRLSLEKNLDNKVIGPSGNKATWTGEVFSLLDMLIFIGATGIAVRFIAPHLQSKDKDPGVVVIDELGNYVIPLLSGHIGGANAFSKVLAKDLGATAVITTATDINNILAIDSYAVDKGFEIINIRDIKNISSKLLKGQEVGFYCDLEEYEVPLGLIEKSTGEIGVCLSYKDDIKPFEITLNLVPKNLVLGIGCRKDTNSKVMRDWVLGKLAMLQISPCAIKAIASIDLKANEQAILDLSELLKAELKVFSKEELETVQGSKATSDFVKSITGVDNVCERAAILESKGRLKIEKIAECGMTLAIAESRI